VSSSWLPVTSGVPKCLVLGPILFIIFIDDLDNNRNVILKFADDTELCGPVKTCKDAKQIQEDLNCLVKWFEEWQMQFNVEKCKVMYMHTGSRS